MTPWILLASLMRDVVQSPDTVAKNMLATAGGALVGALATWVLVAVLCKAMHLRRVPRRPTFVLSLLGAAAVGWAVWMWVSSRPGYGPGAGGAPSAGLGTGKDTAAIPETPSSTRREPPDSLRVTVVRSKDYDRDSQRYYLIEGRPPARNLAETLQVIKDRHQLNPALKTVDVVVYQDSIAETRGVVADLVEPVRQLGLTVKTSKSGDDAP